MKIRVFRVDMSETNTQLKRIADYMQAICRHNDIIIESELPSQVQLESGPIQSADEYTQIVQEHKARK